MPIRYPPQHRNNYGHHHRTLRTHYAKLLWSGTTLQCPHCGDLITHGQDWELDHAPDRVNYRGPAHRTCNRRNTGL